MKPCSKTRSGKSTYANIFLELPLMITYILTYTYNFDTAVGACVIIHKHRQNS